MSGDSLFLISDKIRPLPPIANVAIKNREVATSSAASELVEVNDCFQFYCRELDYLIASLRRLGVPRSDTEDLLHEVFLVMLRRWEHYDRARPLRPWLFGIAFRVTSEHRKRGTRELLRDSHDAEDLGARPDDLVAAGQSRRLLLKALATLPLERRAVLIMHEVDETPMRDIAEQLSIPLFTAYSRLRKARRELDAALGALLKGEDRGR
jgi:RNA polymerase sigma-70 factor (ECF subfamily)